MERGINRHPTGKNAYRFSGGAYSIHKQEGNSYRAMKNRCYSVTYRYYKRYGGRGIKVCDRWLGKDGFSNFLKDMGEKPSSKHSLDRIDNDGNYEPSNCRWSTQKAQVNNSSIPRMITIDGVEKTLGEWCKIYGTRPGMYFNRKREGWDDLLALSTPKLKCARKGSRKDKFVYA